MNTLAILIAPCRSLRRRFIPFALVVVAATLAAHAQEADKNPAKDGDPVKGNEQWRVPDRTAAIAAARKKASRVKVIPTAGSKDDGEDEPADDQPRAPIARVTTGKGVLPNRDGQVWREYDITPYTRRATDSSRSEQAIVDWILRETGYETWHQEPIGLLCANQRSLTAYHTPEVQRTVADVVNRFVSTETESQAFSLRVITVDSPNWRARAHRMLQAVPVETHGVQAWLLQTEDAALLLADLHKRTDYREHSSGHLLVNNGQSTVVSATRPRTYVRDVTLRPESWPGFEAEVGQLDEGFTLELSPLLSLDGTTIDAILKCHIDQLEKLVPVMLEVPTPAAPRQRTKIEVPQISHCRLHERFRWPMNRVLLVGLGMVATPMPAESTPLRMALPMMSGPARADLLVFIESKGKAGTTSSAVRVGSKDVKTYHGRY